MKRYSLLIFIFSAIWLIASSAAAETTEIRTTITNISAEEKAGITEIKIECDALFTYTIYKKSDSNQIMVEFNNVDLGEFNDMLGFKMIINTGAVVDIEPTTEIKGSQSLVRLDITLATPSEIKHSLKGNSLIISVSNTVVKKEEEKPAVAQASEVKKEEEKPAVAQASEVKKEEEKPAASVLIRTSFGGYISKKVVSMRELRYKNIVRQQYDFSCGAASLATITRYLYDDRDVSEQEIVEWLLKNGNLEKIQKRGFSLLDLKMYIENKGYKADGYRVKPEQLQEIKIPTIVLMNTKGYSHFVILKGIKGDKVYIADPALGNRTIPVDEFLAAWNGMIFAVYGKELASTYGGFDGPLSVNKADIWRLNDLMMRNLFMNTMEFRR